MSQSFYQSLQSPETAQKEGAEAAWLATLGAGIRSHREWLAGSLAQAEFEEGLYCNEEQAWEMAKLEPAELAADDKPPLKFPAHYHGGPWRIVLKQQESGMTVIRVDLGPETAEVEVNGVWIHIQKGVEVPLPDVSEPLLQLRIRILGEGNWMLWPR
jgi:hypothetical protein